MMEFIGVLVGILVTATVIALYNRKPENRAEYDERQLMLRGNAYKYGLLTMLLLNAAFMFGTTYFDHLSQYASAFFAVSLFAGILVFAAYSIIKDAFYSVKNRNGSSYLLLLVLCVISQFASIFSGGEWKQTELFLESGRMINLCCGITFLVVLLLLLWKKFAERSEEE